MEFPRVVLGLPGWVEGFVGERGEVYPEVRDRMRLVVGLSRENVRRGTGGPFGAAVFERDTGRLLAPGINLVTGAGCSAAHAEMVAMVVAQRVVGTFDLGGPGLPPCELVASTEPCAMCFGATPWSGVRRLVCGARGEDAEGIGFDEGDKPPDWVGSLERRGIPVVRDVLREEAVAVLREYADGGGEIYNAGRND